MSRTLHVFDIGSFVHAGAVNTHAYIDDFVLEGADGYRQIYIRTGGIAQILNTLHDINKNDTCVFCADRRPSIKQGMLPSYKENRQHKRNIENQKEIIEIILKDCGFNVFYEEGYEADDFVYSVVTKFKNDFDKINVYTCDSDLYFLVSDTVSMQPSHSKAKYVDKVNYPTVISSKMVIPYNTCTIRKILYGDTSDCIPALPIEARAVAELYLKAGIMLEKFGDKAFLDDIAAHSPDTFRKQLDLVWPLTTELPPTLDDNANWERVKMWGGITRSKKFPRVNDIPDDYTEVIEEIKAKQLYED